MCATCRHSTCDCCGGRSDEAATATVSDLSAAVRLWNVHLGGSLPLREEILRLTIFDDPTLREGDVLCAVEGEDVVGFGWTKRWRAPWSDARFEQVGFIGGLVAGAPGHGIGSALLDALEAHLAEEGCQRIEISGGLLHLLPGVPREAAGALRFFERHGYTFETEPHFDLAGDLRTFAGGPTPAARVATEADRPALLDFLAREFPGELAAPRALASRARRPTERLPRRGHRRLGSTASATSFDPTPGRLVRARTGRARAGLGRSASAPRCAGRGSVSN